MFLLIYYSYTNVIFTNYISTLQIDLALSIIIISIRKRTYKAVDKGYHVLTIYLVLYNKLLKQCKIVRL